jgi:hypothetical protein
MTETTATRVRLVRGLAALSSPDLALSSTAHMACMAQ